MHVGLYALQRNHAWQWHLTLDAQVDVRYWQELRYADSGMAALEPSMPFGQAVELLRALSSTGSMEDAIAKAKAMAPHVQWRVIPMGGAGGKVRRAENEGFYRGLVRSLSGRQLLFEEVMSLAEHVASGVAGAELDAHIAFSGGPELDAHIVSRSAPELDAHNLFPACNPGTLPPKLDGIYVDSSGRSGGKIRVDPDMIKAYIQLGLLRGDLTLANGMQKAVKRKRGLWSKEKTAFTCRRCGSGEEKMRVTPCAACGGMCPYCEGCLTMGRVRRCSMLVRGVGGDAGARGRAGDSGKAGAVEGAAVDTGKRTKAVDSGRAVAGGTAASADGQAYRQWVEPWGLSPAQTEAAIAGLRWLDASAGETRRGSGAMEQTARQFLIWAVTGAGKTEMIFPFIAYTLARGGKVLIATPRRDVVLELRPRVMRAFPDAAAVTLYGGSEERWDSGPIVIATTHQLMRFHEAFDLVIVDELDAFPYHGDPQLQFAARHACKPDGCTLLLSATPPRALRRDAVRGKLPHVKVPARYHGRALPVPRQLAVPPLPRMLQAGRMPPALASALAASLARGAQLFVFVPSIGSVEHVVRWLRAAQQLAPAAGLPLVIEGTSSHDEQRTERVQRFRDGEIRVLVTTTILERGVTVPKTDVFILGADSRLFDEAALVQMSGRAGRSKDDPAGNVYFAAAERTKAQSDAIAHIKNMNRLARRKGFLKE